MQLVLHNSPTHWYVLLALLTISVFGCGPTSDTVSVRGDVSYRGEPITRGALTFFPTTGRPITAALSQRGEYDVELRPGKYTVVVGIGTELPPGFKEGDPIPAPKVVLPPEYTTRTRSSLTATIREDQREPIDFELK